MSLREDFIKNSELNLDGEIDAQCRRLLSRVQHDAAVLRQRKATSSAWKKITRRLKGSHNPHTAVLSYLLFEKNSARTTDFDTRYAHSAKICRAIEHALRQSDAFKDLHDLCAAKDTDIRIEHNIKEDYQPRIVMGDFNRVTATITLHIDQPYSVSRCRLARPVPPPQPQPLPSPPPPAVQLPPPPRTAKDRLAFKVKRMSEEEAAAVLKTLEERSAPATTLIPIQKRTPAGPQG